MCLFNILIDIYFMGHSLEKVALHTLGCKLNFSESSTIARDFINQGFSIVKDFENANIHIINSCSVTENADKKAKKIIQKITQTSEDPYITVMGCYAQLKPEEISKFKGVNLVIGDKEKNNVVNHVLENYNTNHFNIIHSPISESIQFRSSFSMHDRVRSYLKIQDGCNYPCSYCTIPKARGLSRSDTIDNIIHNIEILKNNNISEVVLTGVNIGDYKDNNGYQLMDLLKYIDTQNNINRFRISSIEPNLLTEEIIFLIKKSNSFLPHFHIPLQSGSNKILSLMKRKYNTNLYKNKIKMIKKNIPDACIGADVIVGFPNESTDDFLDTVRFINDLDINYLHVFSYSDRDDTVASKMGKKISRSEKLNRSRQLQVISNKKRLKFYQNNLSMIRPVLFESMLDDEHIIGFTDNYIRTIVKGNETMINKIFNIKLLELMDGKVFGEIF